MQAVGKKLSRILLILSCCLALFGVVTLHLSVVAIGALLAISTFWLRAPDREMPTPRAQYWSRGVLLSSIVIFLAGVGFGFAFTWWGIFGGGDSAFMVGILLGVALLGFRLALPNFLESSWHLHEGAPGPEIEAHWSRFVVAACSVFLFTTAAVAGSQLKTPDEQSWALRDVADASAELGFDFSTPETSRQLAR